MRDATRVLHAGIPAAEQGAPFLPGPTFAAPYHLSGDPAGSPYAYGRYHNPTWTAYEQALTNLEGGAGTVVFSSGMAAVTAMLGVTLKAGDVVVMPSDAYYAARVVASGFFATHGVETRFAPTAGDAQAEALPGGRLLWLETPSNPGLETCDIARLAELAHRQGALVVVDNTTATCLGQKPLELGADFSLASDTKATTGHSDLILGHITARDAAWVDRLGTWRSQMGAAPGPMEVWLAHRSLATLHVRLERQCANALAIAQFLTRRPDVVSVRYPGLPGDPAHAVAARQMAFYGPIVSFTLASRARAEAFLRASRLIFEATSFGGVHTSAERRGRWGGDNVPDGFIRLSVGCEAADDLVEDIAQALDATSS